MSSTNISSRAHRISRLFLVLTPGILSIPLAGCTLPQGNNPMAQTDGVGVPNPNPAARGPMYYRYIPSAAHDAGPTPYRPFPGPNYQQTQSLIGVSVFAGAMEMKGVGMFVNNFYAGGFPAVEASVKRCYAQANYYFLHQYGFILGQTVPCLTEDDTAYIYNTLLTENWGRPPYHYFTVTPFARRNLTELRISRQNFQMSKKIMREISDDIQIILPTEIELPVAEDRPGT